MRRRKTAVLLVLTALLAAGFLLWGNCSLQTTETALVSPALPPAFDGLRIVELADLHGRVFGRGSPPPACGRAAGRSRTSSASTAICSTSTRTLPCCRRCCAVCAPLRPCIM